jgi:FKBP-type peptidyl-prolyl cis-trans isomerase 2
MAQAAAGNTVKVHYTGKLDDGSQFDSSVGGEPLEFALGSGGIIPGFENAVLGMAVGETKTVSIPSDEAYGPHQADKVQEVERDKFPAEIQLDVGRRLQAVAAGGETMDLVIIAVREASVSLDFNHPLAGKDLTFELELVEIA